MRKLGALIFLGTALSVGACGDKKGHGYDLSLPELRIRTVDKTGAPVSAVVRLVADAEVEQKDGWHARFIDDRDIVTSAAGLGILPAKHYVTADKHWDGPVGVSIRVTEIVFPHERRACEASVYTGITAKIDPPLPSDLDRREGGLVYVIGEEANRLPKEIQFRFSESLSDIQGRVKTREGRCRSIGE